MVASQAFKLVLLSCRFKWLALNSQTEPATSWVQGRHLPQTSVPEFQIAHVQSKVWLVSQFVPIPTTDSQLLGSVKDSGGVPCLFRSQEKKCFFYTGLLSSGPANN